jgi:SAM-dependent methyltransferase
LFRNYTFRTSSSMGLVEHFRQYANELQQLVGPHRNALVVEIGSNDGTLLKFFQSHGFRTVGVDPAQQICAEAAAAGVETIPEFFSLELAARLERQHGKAAIVAANNVFAHVDQLGDIADGVRELLAPNGVFVFEVSYLVDIVDRLLFDTVYHEHLSYHSVKPLVRFLSNHGMSLTNVRRIEAKGGSIRCYAHLEDAGYPQEKSVSDLLAMEQSSGMDQLETFQRFAAKIAARKDDVLKELLELRSSGVKVAGFGASATVTTLLHQFALADYLEFLVDDNESKWGLLSPGHHLQIRAPQSLFDENVKCVVILAWQYAAPIMKRHQWFREKMGRFLVPLPTVQVY